MQKQKTRFEQVPVAVAEKVLQQATALAGARRALEPLSALEREAAAEVPRRPAKNAGKK